MRSVRKGEQKRKEETVSGRKEKKKRGRKERKGKKGKEEEENGRRTDCSPSIFRRSEDQGVGIVHALRGRGFSYSGYSCLRAIQWSWGSALTAGLVHDSLD